MKISACSLLALAIIGTSATAATTKTEHKNKKLRGGGTKPHDVVERYVRNLSGGLQPRIIGGSRVKNPYPYFALLEIGCGATLIHDDILISAAHCDVGSIFQRRTWIGSVELEGGLERNVVDTIIHPRFDQYDIEYDYMIMKLNTTALLDPYFRPAGTGSGISIALTGKTTPGKQPKQIAGDEKQTDVANATFLYETGIFPIEINRDPAVPAVGDPQKIMGFGVTSQNQFGLVDDLYENTVYAIDDEQCGEYYQELGYTPEVMMCAGHPRGGADTCQGDSGGPMVDVNTNTLSGVTSWGQGCGLVEYPGVYSEVEAVKDWIDEEICKHSCYPPDTCDPAILHPCALAQEGGVVELSGPVEFTITITMDTYPSEFGAILYHHETQTELWFVPFNSYEDSESPLENLLVVEETFSDLPAGVYHLMLGDKSADGLCCNYGNGDVLIMSASGDEIWSTGGRYGSFEEVYFNISATGELIWASNSPDGVDTIDTGSGGDDTGGTPSPPDSIPGGIGDDAFASSTSNYNPAEEDDEWPGAFPTPLNSSNAVTINIRTDRFPGETSWQWHKRTGPDAFELEDDGAPFRSSTVLSYEKFVESDTIYRLRIFDDIGDGTCCAFGLGWFTITNATGSEDFPEDGTVLWRMTGDDFFRLAETFIWVDADGNSHWVEYLPGQGYALVIYELISEERIIVVAEDSKDKKKAKNSRTGARSFGDAFP